MSKQDKKDITVSCVRFEHMTNKEMYVDSRVLCVLMRERYPHYNVCYTLRTEEELLRRDFRDRPKYNMFGYKHLDTRLNRILLARKLRKIKLSKLTEGY